MSNKYEYMKVLIGLGVIHTVQILSSGEAKTLSRDNKTSRTTKDHDLLKLLNSLGSKGWRVKTEITTDKISFLGSTVNHEKLLERKIQDN